MSIVIKENLIIIASPIKVTDDITVKSTNVDSKYQPTNPKDFLKFFSGKYSITKVAKMKNITVDIIKIAMVRIF
jgi:hypothetical protein